MNLEQALTLIAAQVKADAQQLIAFAAEDDLGGFHFNEALRKWPMGSLWGVEGQMLYALVRWLKPENIVQIGGWAGASAAHLALAVKANGKGHITSVDNGGDGNAEHGQLLPDDLKPYVTLIWDNGEEWLARQPDASIDFLFEDASHATELVEILAKLALQKLQPGSVMVNHDAAHDFAYDGNGNAIPDSQKTGLKVRDGLERANVFFRVYRAEPSDCGVAVTVMPGVRNLDRHSERLELKPQFPVNPELVTEEARPIDGNSQTGYNETPPIRVNVDAEAQEPEDPTTPKAPAKTPKPRSRK